MPPPLLYWPAHPPWPRSCSHCMRNPSPSCLQASTLSQILNSTEWAGVLLPNITRYKVQWLDCHHCSIDCHHRHGPTVQSPTCHSPSPSCLPASTLSRILNSKEPWNLSWLSSPKTRHCYKSYSKWSSPLENCSFGNGKSPRRCWNILYLTHLHSSRPEMPFGLRSCIFSSADAGRFRKNLKIKISGKTAEDSPHGEGKSRT